MSCRASLQVENLNCVRAVKHNHAHAQALAKMHVHMHAQMVEAGRKMEGRDKGQRRLLSCALRRSLETLSRKTEGSSVNTLALNLQIGGHLKIRYGALGASPSPQPPLPKPLP